MDCATASDCVDHNKPWKILKVMEITDQGITVSASWETSMQVEKQQLQPDLKQLTGLKLEKEYLKAVYCHLAYLTYMQSISCEMLDWMTHKLESRNINLRYAKWYHPNGRKQRRTKEPPDEGERGEWKKQFKTL